jgi:hypothetical protein
MRLEIVGTRLLFVAHPDEPRSGTRRLERIGDDQRHRLVIVAYAVTVERRSGARENLRHGRCHGRAKIRLWRSIPVRHDADYARCLFSVRDIDLSDAALGDGGAENISISYVVDCMLIGVSRAARHLERPVDAVDRTADEFDIWGRFHP